MILALRSGIDCSLRNWLRGGMHFLLYSPNIAEIISSDFSRVLALKKTHAMQMQKKVAAAMKVFPGSVDQKSWCLRCFFRMRSVMR